MVAHILQGAPYPPPWRRTRLARMPQDARSRPLPHSRATPFELSQEARIAPRPFSTHQRKRAIFRQDVPAYASRFKLLSLPRLPVSPRPTDDAASIILLPDDDPRKAQIMRRLAMQPRVFQQIVAKFGRTLPSDQSLAAYLQIDMEFTKEACPTLIRVLRHALEIAGVDGAVESAENGASGSMPEAPMSAIPNAVAPISAPAKMPLPMPTTQQPGFQHRSWKLGDGVEMSVAIPPRLTRKNLDKLRKYVEVLASEAAIGWEDDEDEA